MFVADSTGVGTALLIGFFVCCFSLGAAFLLVWLDWWAAKKDQTEVTISEEEKFKFSDLKEFKGVPIWLLTICMVFGPMGIDGYCQFSADMLQTRYGFGNLSATLYSVPSIVSVVFSPVIGYTVDRIGKRVHFGKCAITNT